MNKIISIALIAAVTLSCRKEESFSPFVWDYWGEATALKNESVWAPKVIGILDEKNDTLYNLVFDVYSSNEIRRNSLYVHGLSKGKVKLFEITSDSVPEPISSFYATILEDGDVLGDVFKLDKSKDNYIEINEINGNEIKGKFNVTLVRDTSRPKYLESSDTLRFTDGTFHTRIIKAR